QASVTIMIFKWAAVPGMGPGSRRLALRGYRRGLGNASQAGRNPRTASWDASLRRSGPVKNLHIPVGIFDKGSAAFNPVSVIEIEDFADLADFGMVDMAADHAVHAAQGRFARHDLLKAGDVFHRVLDLVLEPGRQRPIGQPEAPADARQDIIA